MRGLTNRQFITLSLIVMLCGLAVLGQDSFKTGKDMAYDNIALAYRAAEEKQNTSDINNTNLDNDPNNLLDPNDNPSNSNSSDDDGDAEDEKYDGSETEGDESSYSYNTGDTSRNVSVKSKKKFKYVGWIKIPKIGLYKGFLANKKNNLFCVDYNICAYDWEGNSPRHENSNLVIGAHNGVRNNAYFRNISKLKKGDFVYIEYKGKSYKYKLIKKYKNRKSKGSIKIEPGTGKNLYLFTCSKEQHYALNYLVLKFELDSESSLN